MKMFEISSKKNKNGRRKFKAILYTIFPDSCVDEANQVGTMYNKNGITWLREYCEKALPSINGMSLRCEFTDEERTELLGHGDTGIADGEPIYEDAVVIGTFTKGYIEDIETDDGVITACIGEGEIDAQCYHNFVTKLEANAANGIYPSGSIEIMHTENNNEIIYKYGYKDLGRIPTEFIHSGYALLGITPADDSAKLIELNEKHKEDKNKMTDLEIKALVEQTVSTYTNQIAEMNECKKQCDDKVEELSKCLDKEKSEKNEIIANSEKIQAALDECRKELEETHKKLEGLYEEMGTLRDELGKAKAKERVGELNAAIANFSDEEKDYAKAEIEAFNADPVASEINSVVNKIWEGIGKAAKADAQAIAEQNAAKAANANIEDIFSEVVESAATSTEDINIF